MAIIQQEWETKQQKTLKVKAKNFGKHTIGNVLAITGYLNDGTPFQRSDTIRITMPVILIILS